MPGGSRRRKQREREAQEKRSDEEKTVMPQLRSSNMTTRSMTSNAVSSATGPDLSHVTPDALLSHTPVYSKIRHQENLLFLFTQRAKDGAVRKMHQTWMECRSRCVEALRSNRPAVINAKSGSKSEIEHTLAEFEKFLKFVGPDKNLNLYKFVKEVVFDNIMLLHLEADRSGYLNEVRKPHRSHFQVFEQLAAMPKNSGKPKSNPPVDHKTLAPANSVAAPSHLAVVPTHMHVAPASKDVVRTQSKTGQKEKSPHADITTAHRKIIEDFKIDPDSMKDVDMIVGCIEARRMLLSSTSVPSVAPHLARYFPRSILLHGISGTGKTTLAMSIAKESKESSVYLVRSCDVDGQSSTKQIIHALLAIAQENAPSVIILDEVETFFHSNNGPADTISELSTLTRYPGVTIVGTTNRPWALDRASRHLFKTHIHIPLPSEDDRLAIFKLKLYALPHTITEAEFSAFASQSNLLPGAAIEQGINLLVQKSIGIAMESAHFREIEVNGFKWLCACTESERGARAMDYKTVAHRLVPEPLSADALWDMMFCVGRQYGWVEKAEADHAEWNDNPYTR